MFINLQGVKNDKIMTISNDFNGLFLYKIDDINLKKQIPYV